MTAPWVPWALGTALALIVAFVAVLITADRRKEARMGQHSWLGDRDVDNEPGFSPPAREVQHAPGTCTAAEAGEYEVCEDRKPGEGVTDEDGTD